MFQKYRILWVVYGLALLAGAREFMVSRQAGGPTGPMSCEASAASCSVSGRAAASDEDFWRQHAEMADLVARLNPDDPDTHFLKGMQALAEGDEEGFVRAFEKALESGVKHNPYLLHHYAQYMVDRGEDWRLVNRAVNAWRNNHQFSTETITLRLGSGPRDREEVDLVRRELETIPWVARASLEQSDEDGTPTWRARLGFEPGGRVDMREAVAAVTILALPPQHRSTHRVTCSTLQDCNAVPRRAP